jgi:hypothetical protein
VIPPGNAEVFGGNLLAMVEDLQRSWTRYAIYTRKSSEEGLEKSFNSPDAHQGPDELFGRKPLLHGRDPHFPDPDLGLNQPSSAGPFTFEWSCLAFAARPSISMVDRIQTQMLSYHW